MRGASEKLLKLHIPGWTAIGHRNAQTVASRFGLRENCHASLHGARVTHQVVSEWRFYSHIVCAGSKVQVPIKNAP